MHSPLATLQNQIFNHATLSSYLQDYARPNDKISELLARQELISLKKGLYTLGGDGSWYLSRGLVANHLYGQPSYVSRHWMLSFYGLLTERVIEVTSICMERSRRIITPLGRFSYIALPARYYSTGLTIVKEHDNSFIAATPEKALCDLLVTTPNLRLQSIKAMQKYLIEDLRVELDELIQLNIGRLEICASCAYKSVMLTTLLNTIRKWQND
ncbi:MAG: hypothetical protein RLZZ422_329 [Pseudomonadota bacterium]|jgi:hypothetical protein